jgi:hypothetical protein
LSQIAATTSANSNAPCSFAICAWKTTCSSRSPELVLQVDQVIAVDRIGDFVSLFDRVRRDGREILRQVPRTAAVGIAQFRHDREQRLDLA